MTLPRRTSRLAAGLGIAGASVLLLAAPAAADTSQATARAAFVSLLGAPVLDTGTAEAENDGTQDPVVDSSSTGVLGGQTLLTAGVLAQSARANPDGTSAACAGAVGSGGTIQIGEADDCTANIGTPDGVTLNLGGTGAAATLGADAIFAECTASTTGATGQANLINLELNGDPLVVTGGVDQSIDVGGLATVTVNEQTPIAGGGIRVVALRVVLLEGLTGTALAEIVIGEVTCGPNAVGPIVSIFSGPALPAAATGAAVVGVAFVVRRRRQTA